MAHPASPVCQHHARLAGRSRAGLGYGLTFFAAGYLGLMLAAECWPRLADPEYACKIKNLRRQLDAAPGGPLVLALGSSRAEFAFRPDALPACRTAEGEEPVVFNLALHGTNHVTELGCLHRLLGQSIRPRWLLIELIPSYLFWEGSEIERKGFISLDNKRRWTDVPYVRPYCRGYWNQGARHYLPLPEHWRHHWLQVLSQYAGRFADSEFTRCESIYWKQQDRFGWVPNPAVVGTPELRQASLRQMSGILGAPFTWSEPPRPIDHILRDLLALCRGEGITPVLVIYPESSGCRNWYTPMTRQALDRYLAGLERTYGSLVVDASDWIADEGFGDCHHLTPAGAAAFSRRFGSEVLQPLLEGRYVSRSLKLGEPPG